MPVKLSAWIWALITALAHAVFSAPQPPVVSAPVQRPAVQPTTTQQAPAPVNPAPAGKPATVPECPSPQYIYTDWVRIGEDRSSEDQWVVQRLQYQRTRTDTCTGATTIEAKSEGPYRLWQAVPDRRVSGVSHPEGETGDLTGSPLRSSELPAGPAPVRIEPKPQSVPKASTDTSGQPDKQVPYLPGALLLIGVAVAALQQKRRRGSDGPGSVLALKEQQYLALAERGMYGTRSPNFKDDPMFAESKVHWEDLPAQTRATIVKWQQQWNEVSEYWQKVFAGRDPGGPPPTDPWGVAGVAQKQATERLQAEIAALRTPLLDLAADQGRLEEMLPQIKEITERIEHLRGVLASEVSEKVVQEALSGDQDSLTGLVLALKARQYTELTHQGRFDVLDPQFGSDSPFTILWPVVNQDAVKRGQAAWKVSAAFWSAVFRGQAPAGDAPSDLPGVNASALDRLSTVYGSELRAAWEKAAGGGADPRSDARLQGWAKVLGPDDPAVRLGDVVSGLNGPVLDAMHTRDQALVRVKGPGLSAGAVASLLDDLRAVERAEESGLGIIRPGKVNLSESMRAPLLGLVHQAWQDRAAGRSYDESPLAAVMADVRVPSDVREDMQELQRAYERYWQAVEARYQAILRLDQAGVDRADRAIADATAVGLPFRSIELSEIPVLGTTYEHIIEEVVKQAQLVFENADDKDYARLGPYSAL